MYAASDRVISHSGTFGGETNAEVLLHARGAMCARPRRYRRSALHAACIDAIMHGASGRAHDAWTVIVAHAVFLLRGAEALMHYWCWYRRSLYCPLPEGRGSDRIGL